MTHTERRLVLAFVAHWAQDFPEHLLGKGEGSGIALLRNHLEVWDPARRWVEPGPEQDPQRAELAEWLAVRMLHDPRLVRGLATVSRPATPEQAAQVARGIRTLLEAELLDVRMTTPPTLAAEIAAGRIAL